MWKDASSGRVNYAPGWEESLNRTDARAKEVLSVITGTDIGGIGSDFVESDGGRTISGQRVYTAGGKKYRFDSDGRSYRIETLGDNAEWTPVSGTLQAFERERRTAQLEADQSEVDELTRIILEKNIPAPNGPSERAWNSRSKVGIAQQLAFLRRKDREAYERYKAMVEAAR